jgi:hypothetical protein
LSLEDRAKTQTVVSAVCDCLISGKNAEIYEGIKGISVSLYLVKMLEFIRELEVIV